MSDSSPDTFEHIHQVQRQLIFAVAELQLRMLLHDRAKLFPPERAAYDHIAGLDREKVKYGTEEYKAVFADIQPAIQHHYAEYPHHPEHHQRGVNDMTLIDLLEMVCDWRAAGLRHGGTVADSIGYNQERFGLSDQLRGIIMNTSQWLDEQQA